MAMKIHAIQTGTVAVHERQRRGKGTGILRLINAILDRNWTEPLPIYAWLIEHPEGLIVVDTGETAHSTEAGYFPWWHPYFRFAVRCYVRPEEEVGPQLQALGFQPRDVRWVVLTHLHTDHAGGLHHFPDAEILVSSKEHKTASGLMGSLRGFLPNRWPDWFSPRLVDFEPEPVGPFAESYPLTQVGDVQLVPTPGHTPGHLSLVVDSDHTKLFFAGDASYTEELMIEQIVDGVSPNEKQARESLAKIREFSGQYRTVYLPAHDPGSADRLAKRRAVSL